MERTDECTESEKKRGYATKLHGWSPLRNLVGPLQQSVINTATTTSLPLHGRFDWPRPQRPREWRSSLRTEGMPRRSRAGVRRSCSYSRARIYDYSLQYKSSPQGFGLARITTMRANMVFHRPGARPRGSRFHSYNQRFRPGVIRVLL